MRQTKVCSNRVFVPGVHASPRRSEMEEKEKNKKQRALKNNFTKRKHFMRRYQRNGWMDFSELRATDSLHNEGTNTLVMDGLGLKGWFVKRGCINKHH